MSADVVEHPYLPVDWIGVAGSAGPLHTFVDGRANPARLSTVLT